MAPFSGVLSNALHCVVLKRTSLHSQQKLAALTTYLVTTWEPEKILCIQALVSVSAGKFFSWQTLPCQTWDDSLGSNSWDACIQRWTAKEWRKWRSVYSFDCKVAMASAASHAAYCLSSVVFNFCFCFPMPRYLDGASGTMIETRVQHRKLVRIVSRTCRFAQLCSSEAARTAWNARALTGSYFTWCWMWIPEPMMSDCTALTAAAKSRRPQQLTLSTF